MGRFLKGEIKCFMKYLRPFSHCMHTLFIHFQKTSRQMLTGLTGPEKTENKVVSNLIKTVMYQWMHVHQHIIVGSCVSATHIQQDRQTSVFHWKISKKFMLWETNEGWKGVKRSNESKAFEVSSLLVCSRKKHFHHIQFDAQILLKIPFQHTCKCGKTEKNTSSENQLKEQFLL